MNNNETVNTANTVSRLLDPANRYSRVLLFGLTLVVVIGMLLLGALMFVIAGDMFLDSVDGNCILWEVRGATDQFVRNNC